MAGLDSGFVVIGFDGTRESIAALRWGLQRASRTRAAAKIVHCWPVPRARGRRPPSRGWTVHDGFAQDGRVQAVRAVESQVAAAQIGLPEPPEVGMVFAAAEVASVLAAQCRGADLLVLGASVPGVLVDPARGPVAGPCLERVGCPVALVDRQGRVTTTQPRHPALGLVG